MVSNAPCHRQKPNYWTKRTSSWFIVIFIFLHLLHQFHTKRTSSCFIIYYDYSHFHFLTFVAQVPDQKNQPLVYYLHVPWLQSFSFSYLCCTGTGPKEPTLGLLFTCTVTTVIFIFLPLLHWYRTKRTSPWFIICHHSWNSHCLPT